jgi:hypothetical protein
MPMYFTTIECSFVHPRLPRGLERTNDTSDLDHTGAELPYSIFIRARVGRRPMSNHSSILWKLAKTINYRLIVGNQLSLAA